MKIYLQATHCFMAEGADDKTLRVQLQMLGIDGRRLTRFSQLILLGALPLADKLQGQTAIFCGSPFNSPRKFDKIFENLMQHNLPSPLDFMANLNNAATFQLAQALQTHGNAIFLALNRQSYWQPLALAILELLDNDCDQALVGWGLESITENTTEREGAVFWLLGTSPTPALAEVEFITEDAPDMSAGDFLAPSIAMLEQLKREAVLLPLSDGRAIRLASV
ncbi:Uncharacterised protein [Haemophilus pittmaniae]|uniref:Beta-ketoacyl synthase N-terminal domain-containing protein n=1 Tax=Haemophilus pittmaniae TaxID=249188 RepID=A0A377IYA9_9PAST|nr:beta-ketoacyl synthase chain length factor [Haemophilus pittmaniae]STO92958.1 Uncharacterised protein [Haemophilus pittmaniae]